MAGPTNEDSGAGVAGRMIRTLTAPGETFASVRERMTLQDWLAPTIVVMVAGLVVGMMALPAVMDPASGVMQEEYGEMTEEQRAVMEQMAEAMGLVLIPIGTFLWLFVAGGVLLLLANPILGGEATYGQMLAVTAYASLAKLAQTIVIIPILLSTGSLVIIGPGLLLSEEMLATFAGRVLAGFEIFTLWQILLMAVGTGVMAGCSTRRALIPLLILWAVVIVAQAGLASLGELLQP